MNFLFSFLISCLIYCLLSFIPTDASSQEVKILIAPIDTTNVPDKAYLSQAIPQVLISRVNRVGEISVTEIKEQLPKTKDKKKTDELDRYLEIAKKNNANFLITGKVLSTNRENQIDIFLINTQTNQPESHFKYRSDNLNDLLPRLNEFSQETINKVRYRLNEAKSDRPSVVIEKTSPEDKPMLLAPVSPDAPTDDYRAHPDKLMRTGKAQQKVLEERKKNLTEKKIRTQDDQASRPKLVTPMEEKAQTEREKREGFLSKIGINVPSERYEAIKTPENIQPSIDKEKLRSNISVDEGNIITDSQKPLLLAPGSRLKDGQIIKYNPSDQRNETKIPTTSFSSLPFPAPEDVKPLGRQRQSDTKIPLNNVEKVEEKKEEKKTEKNVTTEDKTKNPRWSWF